MTQTSHETSIVPTKSIPNQRAVRGGATQLNKDSFKSFASCMTHYMHKAKTEIDKPKTTITNR